MATEQVPEYASPTAKEVTLRTARDYSLVTTSLESRQADLVKLAQKTRAEGYVTEARVIEADAGAISEFILPQFRDQRELPLVTEDDVQSLARDAIWAIVHRYSVVSDAGRENAKTDAAYERMQGKREQELSEEIAERVASYSIEIAERAYAAGFAARGLTPESLSARSIPALRGDIRGSVADR